MFCAFVFGYFFCVYVHLTVHGKAKRFILVACRHSCTRNWIPLEFRPLQVAAERGFASDPPVLPPRDQALGLITAQAVGPHGVEMYSDEQFDTSLAGAEDEYANVSLSTVGLHSVTQITFKIPPSFNGSGSWFAYEDLIDEWDDVTELPEEKRGPDLRNRLEGEAAIYKPLLEVDKLKDPDNGVTYFKAALRPYFVKGAASVFLWRFFTFMRFH